MEQRIAICLLNKCSVSVCVYPLFPHACMMLQTEDDAGAATLPLLWVRHEGGTRYQLHTPPTWAVESVGLIYSIEYPAFY